MKRIDFFLMMEMRNTTTTTTAKIIPLTDAERGTNVYLMIIWIIMIIAKWLLWVGHVKEEEEGEEEEGIPWLHFCFAFPSSSSSMMISLFGLLNDLQKRVPILSPFPSNRFQVYSNVHPPLGTSSNRWRPIVKDVVVTEDWGGGGRGWKTERERGG